MKCNLCLKEATLVDSHIVPKSFYEIQKGSKPMLNITNKAEEYAKKCPIGEYDQLICLACEDSFGPYDDYAFKLFLGELWKPEVVQEEGRGIGGFLLQEVKCEMLQLFALSVLWRAAVSQRAMFSKVSLGPHLEPIRMLLNREIPVNYEYGVIFGRYTDTEFPLIFDPHPERYEGINYYRIYLGKYVMYIKVDQRETFPTGRNVMLGETSALMVIARQAEGNELRVAKSLARHNERLKGGRGK